MMLGAYYEGVGVLVERGLIDVTLVDDLLWAGLKDFWERMEPSLREVRQCESNQRFYDHMERLYNHIQKLEQQRTNDST